MADLLEVQRFNRKSYWAEAARALKRAVLGRRTIKLLGNKYSVAYEVSNVLASATVDYLLIERFSAGLKCVFDIGANVGLTTLIMAASVDHESGEIYAFEACESSCLVIRENLLLNGYADKVRIINAVVSQRSGRTTEFHWDFVSPNSSQFSTTSSGMSIALTKASLALDDFVFCSKLSPAFIKIDVEGAEAEVVHGMKNTLEKYRPIVLVELHAWPGKPVAENVADILDVLATVNYEMIDLRTKRLVNDRRFFKDVPAINSGVQAQARAVLRPAERQLPTWFSSFDTSVL